MKIFKQCKHAWIKQSDVVLPAPAEQVESIDGRLSEFFFKKTHIVVLTCDRCGKIYKSVVRG